MNDGIKTQIKNPYVTYSQLLAPRAEDTSTVCTSDYVIAFARARANHVNAWLNRQLQVMRDGARDTQAINDVLAVFAEYSEGFGRDNNNKDVGNPEAMKKCKAALTKAIEDLPPGSPLRAKLADLRDKDSSILNQKGGGGRDEVVLKEEMGSMIKDLESELKKIDRGSQEGQLLINQKMGEKSEIMQLAAMMLQQFNETVKAILQRS